MRKNKYLYEIVGFIGKKEKEKVVVRIKSLDLQTANQLVSVCELHDIMHEKYKGNTEINLLEVRYE